MQRASHLLQAGYLVVLLEGLQCVASGLVGLPVCLLTLLGAVEHSLAACAAQQTWAQCTWAHTTRHITASASKLDRRYNRHDSSGPSYWIGSYKLRIFVFI